MEYVIYFLLEYLMLLKHAFEASLLLHMYYKRHCYLTFEACNKMAYANSKKS